LSRRSAREINTPLSRKEQRKKHREKIKKMEKNFCTLKASHKDGVVGDISGQTFFLPQKKKKKLQLAQEGKGKKRRRDQEHSKGVAVSSARGAATSKDSHLENR